MSWSAYAGFLAFAVALGLLPRPDFAVVTDQHSRHAGDPLAAHVGPQYRRRSLSAVH